MKLRVFVSMFILYLKIFNFIYLETGVLSKKFSIPPPKIYKIMIQLSALINLLSIQGNYKIGFALVSRFSHFLLPMDNSIFATLAFTGMKKQIEVSHPRLICMRLSNHSS